MELEEVTNSVTEHLNQLPFVNSLDFENNKLYINTDTQEDYRPQISRAIAAARGTHPEHAGQRAFPRGCLCDHHGKESFTANKGG